MSFDKIRKKQKLEKVRSNRFKSISISKTKSVFIHKKKWKFEKQVFHFTYQNFCLILIDLSHA